MAAGGQQVRALQVCRDGSDFRQWLLPRTGEVPDSVWRRIESALQHCRRLVVLCSHETASSSWVDREVAWMLKTRGPDHVWLAIAAGTDPSTQPDGIVPPAAIAAGLHTRQIWYDLRQWRGLRGDSIRDAEDELVRLAVDLLDLPADKHPGLAAVWQREETRRRRRQAMQTMTAAAAVVAGAGLAAWQFNEASNRALQAQASSQVRVAEAALERSPLLGTLVALEWQPQYLPADAMGMSWRLLGSEIPQARIRGHERGVVKAGWLPDGRVWAVDRIGVVSLSPADGQGKSSRLVPRSPAKVEAVQASADGKRLWVAEATGTLREVQIEGDRLLDAGVACRLPAGDVRHLSVAPGGRWLLLSGYQHRVYSCDLQRHGESAYAWPISGRLALAWFDAVHDSWLMMSDGGDLWQARGNDREAKR
ncbi:TIR domain-containing protein, partial [Candidatus Accumulibacter phosphatis]|uniref:TIR domain-containing protein n=1 Tax=Candidatus Accumulibacter phosphatis TaxID=327160 RepID=UPI003013FD13